MTEDLLPVETLDSLSRQEGVDVRPILVRVLTDLFIQKPHHAPEEVARYEELTLQLLEVVNVETRAIVARKLADEPRAPRTIIARLLQDELEVAAPLLSRFPDLPRQTLLTLALDGGPAEAAAVAGRADIDGDMVRILAHHPDDLVLETLVANLAAKPGEATLAALVGRALQSPALASGLLARTDLDAAGLAPLYLHATRERRAEIRAALAARTTRSAFAARPLRNVDAVDAALVEAAAESGRGHVIAEALGQALGLKPSDASWLAAEPSGEAFVMMLRAAGVEADGVARALLICKPEIARSVTSFFELVEVAETTSRAVAADLVAAFIGGEIAKPQARHEPLFDPSGAVERAGAARASQRPRRGFVRPGEAGRQRG
ncbi:MAG TPA: DUF2336 domain-containing protein [Hansschlegelia sp.]